MTKKLRTVSLAAISSGLLFAAALGCSPPPDTSPAVSILSPVNGETLPAGKAIDVRFMISGIDSTGPTMVPFSLAAGASKVYGKGKVRAYINNSNFLAQTVSIPTDGSPFLVPDSRIGDPAALVRPGMQQRITLQLYYNDDSISKVDPQREGTVIVNIQ